MECSECQFDNREGVKFCEECGAKFELECPACKANIPFGRRFCGECGYNLMPAKETPEEVSESENQPSPLSKKESSSDVKPIAGERKHVTVLFSDLIGYTTMSENLDPEDVKEITSKIFGEIAKIIDKYEGFIEKYIGDAVMAIFGAKKTYEDDPIRAIKAAMEISKLVQSLSLDYERKIGLPLCMHSGINTGLVITGEVDLEKGTHGIAGDTINLAARLSSLGNENEILVGPDTYVQADGFFDFEALEPAHVKGKAEPVRAYKVLSIKEQPKKVHRLQGVRANLIGRKAEIAQLKEAIARLKQKEGLTISICGTAGTGKSRLVEEFKSSLDLRKIQWLEGYAYPYAQNIPYFPLINLLNQALQIEDGDSPEKVRKKIETGLSVLVGEEKGIVPYVGSLYSLSYPEIDEVSPEFWKAQLQKAILSILSALAKTGPTVICFEDLHWSDLSFLELVRNILSEFKGAALFICIYRPIISLFSSQQTTAMFNPYHEIRTQDLSPSEAQDMIESLLNTENIPAALQRFVQSKAEGNPFYLEEVINSLIESKTLIQDNGDWKISRTITESDISSTIHGVISARLDRLEDESKRILQEASVIGRAFYYEIINKITELKSNIDGYLSGLERLDLIKTKSFQPDVEYIFKHSLTQEVVYSGLLKQDRKAIHERIGVVMEHLFQDRLPEFYEMLAYHFSRGKSVLKAVNYLVKSGEKSLKRYSVDESNNYFKNAFEIIIGLPEKSNEINEILIDMLNRWAYVYYYRGDFKSLDALLSTHEKRAESIADKEKTGMFYAWQGNAFWLKCEYKKSYEYLKKAKKMGEQVESITVTGYATTWLSYVCAELGIFEEGIQYGEQAQNIAQSIKSDHYLYFKSLAGIGYNYYFMGYVDKCIKIGKTLIEYGQRHSNIRCLVMGYVFKGSGYQVAGDFLPAIDEYHKALEVAVDPFYNAFPTVYLAVAYLWDDNIEEAEKLINDVISYCDDFGCGNLGSFAKVCYGAILISKGNMSKGMQIIKDARQAFIDQGRKGSISFAEYTLGRVYLEMAKGGKSVSPMTIVKNFGFIIKNVPSSAKRAELQLNRTLQSAKEVGAIGNTGMAYLSLGILNQIKKRNDQARDHLGKAIQIFEETGAYEYLKQANEALKSL